MKLTETNLILCRRRLPFSTAFSYIHNQMLSSRFLFNFFDARHSRLSGTPKLTKKFRVFFFFLVFLFFALLLHTINAGNNATDF